MKQTIVSAMFRSRGHAERALSRLVEMGASDKSLSLLCRTDRGIVAAEDVRADCDEAHVFRGVLGGGALGAGLGVAALALPGVGPAAAAGAIAASAVPAALTLGAAAGAAAGTMNEVLDKDGLGRGDRESRTEASCYLVSIDTGEAEIGSEAAEEALRSFGGYDIFRAEAMR